MKRKLSLLATFFLLSIIWIRISALADESKTLKTNNNGEPPGTVNVQGSLNIPVEAVKLNNESNRYHVRGEYGKAIELLAKVIKIAPHYADAHNNLAASYLGERIFNKALSSVKTAIDIDPKNGRYHSTLGLIYYTMNDLNNCIVSFNKAISLGYKTAALYSVLGNAYGKNDMLDEAIAAYKAALQINPLLRGARNNLRKAEKWKKEEQ